MFDLSITKMLVLVVIALVIFGPDQLPKMASQLGRGLRDLHRLGNKAKADLQEGLGPEFSDFDVADLRPKNFVRKHLLNELNGPGATAAARPHPMDSAEHPPFDTEAD